MTSDTTKSLPMSVEALIPHQKPMCLIDQLIAFDDEGGTVEAFVPADSPLLDENSQLDPLAAAEFIAQAFAAVKGYADLLSGEPVKQGLLVGIKKTQFLGDVYAGDRLQITVHTVGAISGFALVAGEVKRGPEIVARGELKLWIQDDAQSESEIK
jgi:predicted hotdog family 3-hydroxylacyl-ACP dehydratase